MQGGEIDFSILVKFYLSCIICLAQLLPGERRRDILRDLVLLGVCRDQKKKIMSYFLVKNVKLHSGVNGPRPWNEQREAKEQASQR